MEIMRNLKKFTKRAESIKLKIIKTGPWEGIRYSKQLCATMNVEIYIDELEGEQNLIATALNDLMMTYPEVTHKIRYKVPFYYRKSWICYINPIKKDGIEFCFLRADELSNQSGILDFKKRTQVAGISIFDHKKIPLEGITEVINEAMLLDEEVKYVPPSKRMK